MHRFHRSHIRIRQQGQTLVIALIVLGVLLVLGLVFLGLINRNILNAARSQRRSEASDLAEAGVRYAHGQLVTSPLGADWRGVPTALEETALGSDMSRDPDAYYLRPGYLPNAPAQSSGVLGDLGGPDGLGPFIRLPFPGGRALVRVRYGATDATPTPAIPGGPLRNPGAARSQIIIEAFGRPGVIKPKDPTTFNTEAGFKFRHFANQGELTGVLSRMARANGQVATSRKATAFVPIGIIDFARFETNVFNSSAPIDLGIADGLGIKTFDSVRYQANPAIIDDNFDVGSILSFQLGSPGNMSIFNTAAQRGFGSFMANGDVRFYGTVNAYLNRALGDGIRASGRFMGANGGSLKITPVQFVPGTGYVTQLPITLIDNGTLSFDSQDPTFNTAGGLLLDGSPRTDLDGYASGIGALPPPSALTIDPQTKLNRYVALTRESGKVLPLSRFNNGQFGHGRGVYVNNVSDRQEPLDAKGRSAAGSQRSLFDDWLNPNSAANGDTGWQGPFYVPRSAVVQLLPDGFSIQRNLTAPDKTEHTWRRPDGVDSGDSTLRYRIGRATDGSVRIVNGLQDPGVNGGTPNFNLGQPFDGILYFEGNVRVRGTIPTNVQMTLVSGATIYIDGSIVKGTTNNDVTGGTSGAPIQGLPKATLMLMARDNVAVNTPNFFGPIATQSLKSSNDTSGATGISPVTLSATGGVGSDTPTRLEFVHELVLDPTGPTNTYITDASQWKPYAMNYEPFDSSNKMATQLLLGMTMDDGAAAASFLAMNVNGETATSAYAFNAFDTDRLITNAVANYANLDPATNVNTKLSLYGLGAEPWQRYSTFEKRSFTIIDPTIATYTAGTGRITQTGVNYVMGPGSNTLLLQTSSMDGVSSNDTLIGRAALVPNDVKIEASIFAEQGSFFIIPGPWFNPDPTDTHGAYARRIEALVGTGLDRQRATYQANRERLESSGASPSVPFYGEPIDVRINIVGSVAENLPPPISVQSEWVRKWGWIPSRIGATGLGIPKQHVPADMAADMADQNFVPNIVIQYDPALATGRLNDPLRPEVIRMDDLGRPLPPMPRLPVSPKLAYFGEL